jgi:hypothetical protein
MFKEEVRQLEGLVIGAYRDVYCEEFCPDEPVPLDGKTPNSLPIYHTSSDDRPALMNDSQIGRFIEYGEIGPPGSCPSCSPMGCDYEIFYGMLLKRAISNLVNINELDEYFSPKELRIVDLVRSNGEVPKRRMPRGVTDERLALVEGGIIFETKGTVGRPVPIKTRSYLEYMDRRDPDMFELLLSGEWVPEERDFREFAIGLMDGKQSSRRVRNQIIGWYRTLSEQGALAEVPEQEMKNVDRHLPLFKDVLFLSAYTRPLVEVAYHCSECGDNIPTEFDLRTVTSECPQDHSPNNRFMVVRGTDGLRGLL